MDEEDGTCLKMRQAWVECLIMRQMLFKMRLGRSWCIILVFKIRLWRSCHYCKGFVKRKEYVL